MKTVLAIGVITGIGVIVFYVFKLIWFLISRTFKKKKDA